MSGHPVHECQHLSQVLTRWHDFFCMRLCAATLLTSGTLSNSLCEITTRIHKLTYVRRGPTDSRCLGLATRCQLPARRPVLRIANEYMTRAAEGGRFL